MFKRLIPFIGLGFILVAGGSPAQAQSATAGCCLTTTNFCFPRTAAECPSPYQYLPLGPGQTDCNQLTKCTQPAIPPLTGCCQPSNASVQCSDNSSTSVCPPPNLLLPGKQCSAVSACAGRLPTSSSSFPASSSTPSSKSTGIPIPNEVVIPNFGGTGQTVVDGQTIANYIRAVFIYFVWTVGIVAVFMIVYGAVRWIAAGGNPGRINDARTTVDNAVIGLIIALTSVVLLRVINPELTVLPSIDTGVIQPEKLNLDDVVGENGEGAAGGACLTKNGTPIRLEVNCAYPVVMSWPVGGVSAQVIKSRVGPRDVQVGSACHPGTDFSTDQTAGKPVLAVVGGTISAVSQVCGESAVVLNTKDFHVRYVHIHSAAVAVGQTVEAGSLIGYSGGDPNTSQAVKSCSSGPHVHIELYDNAKKELHDIAPCVTETVPTAPSGAHSEF